VQADTLEIASVYFSFKIQKSKKFNLHFAGKTSEKVVKYIFTVKSF